MRTRLCALLVVIAAPLVLAACGGGGGEKKQAAGGGAVPAGADYVPSSAVGFVSVNSDTESSQWKDLRSVLAKFPAEDELIARLQQELAKQQVDLRNEVLPAVGPEVAIGVLSYQGGQNATAVGLTRPKDRGKAEALFRKIAKDGSAVFKQIGDWLAASDSQSAVDAADTAHGGTSLADDSAFKEAMGDLPADALVKLWFDGEALTRQAQSRTGGRGSIPGFGRLLSLAAALAAKGDGASITAVAKTDQPIKFQQYASKLVSQVPAGVLAYLSVRGIDELINNLAGIPAVKQRIGELEGQLGVTLAELAPLFAGEGALYVRQGVPLPEVTLVLEQADTAAAQATADKLFTRLAPALQAQQTTTTISGASVKQLRTQNFSIYYGTFDGKLVVTTATTGVSGLREDGQKLDGDSLFTEAKGAAGMPDETAGFLYLNLKDAVPLVVNLVQSSGTNVDAVVRENLEPLKSLVLFETIDGAKVSVSGFLGVE
jgi:hypothetical protein